VAVLHLAHTSGFFSALEQLSHSVELLLSLSAAASSVLGIWSRRRQEQLQASSKSTHDLNIHGSSQYETTHSRLL
jgi:hypothetical protein